MPPIKAISPRAALEKLRTTCDRAEISSGEARQKLRRWGVPSSAAEQIIATLERARYIDDARFAGAYVRDKARHALWGPRKIALSLRQKGVRPDIIDSALDEITPDEQLRALAHLLEVKTSSQLTLLTDMAGRTKLYRYAVMRGFPSHIVSKALRLLSAQTPD